MASYDVASNVLAALGHGEVGRLGLGDDDPRLVPTAVGGALQGGALWANRQIELNRERRTSGQARGVGAASAYGY